ncbi:hypothetical protein SKAU_G00384450 [Synaphobranchus kaupii]|uniref:Uncharacterized protein n=1 Tax=Synaphobranchus kaupii TaxID=118154 RepID=A0A9Q1EEE2_SYNKA|nr:hypothetical protein SKAU_G00384450 [Synaphobranchus kaupii]
MGLDPGERSTEECGRHSRSSGADLSLGHQQEPGGSQLRSRPRGMLGKRYNDCDGWSQTRPAICTANEHMETHDICSGDDYTADLHAKGLIYC